MYKLILILFLALSTARASQVYSSFIYPVIQTAADETSGAEYFRKHSTHSFVGALGCGFEIHSAAYLGLRYEYWVSDRKYDLFNVSYNHRLSYQTLGVEAGYHFNHPRVWWALLVGAHYPWAVSSGNFSASPSLQYQARAMLEIRVARSLWVLLETGWRWANLGVLSDGDALYVDGGGNFDLSGAFVSFGVAFHF